MALAWPVGPLTFVAVVGLLLAVSPIAFPAFGAAVLGAGLLLWLALS